MPGGPLFVTRFSTPGAFLQAAEPFLVANEVENNLILGISRDLARDPSGLLPNPYFAVVTGSSGICMAAFSTIPGRAAITRDTVDGAKSALVRDMDGAVAAIEGILGPDPTIEHFARELAALRGLRTHLRMRQRIHQLVRVNGLDRLPAGTLRRATAADNPLLIEWLGAFQVEIGEPAPVNRTIEHRVSNGEMYVWDDGEPRSMAGWSGKTPNGVRVNAVYTPPESRGQGYATATVAALSQLLLGQGNRFCCLYTDLANPTSNAIYQRIGYSEVSDSSVYFLATGRRET